MECTECVRNGGAWSAIRLAATRLTAGTADGTWLVNRYRGCGLVEGVLDTVGHPYRWRNPRLALTVVERPPYATGRFGNRDHHGEQPVATSAPTKHGEGASAASLVGSGCCSNAATPPGAIA